MTATPHDIINNLARRLELQFNSGSEAEWYMAYWMYIKKKGYTSQWCGRKAAWDRKAEKGSGIPEPLIRMPKEYFRSALGKQQMLCDLLTDKDKTYQAVTSSRSGDGYTGYFRSGSGKTIAQKIWPMKKCRKLWSAALRENTIRFRRCIRHSKLTGKRLYELAREGQEVERKARRITIHEIRILEINLPEVKLEVTCSKGNVYPYTVSWYRTEVWLRCGNEKSAPLTGCRVCIGWGTYVGWNSVIQSCRFLGRSDYAGRTGVFAYIQCWQQSRCLMWCWKIGNKWHRSSLLSILYRRTACLCVSVCRTEDLQQCMNIRKHLVCTVLQKCFRGLTISDEIYKRYFGILK